MIHFREAGITKETPNPIGGIIMRNKDGEPNGILLENAGNMILDKAFDIEKYPGSNLKCNYYNNYKIFKVKRDRH
jgi:predicted amidohydrolase YtcJ